MHIGGRNAKVFQILTELFTQPLRKGDAENAFILALSQPDLLQDIVDLGVEGPYLYFRFHQPGGPYDLFDKYTVGLFQLIVAWCSTDKDRLVDHPFPDRKSTRLNSSHVATSYAVFCLTKQI